jgi:hypothetical protein
LINKAVPLPFFYESSGVCSCPISVSRQALSHILDDFRSIPKPAIFYYCNAYTQAIKFEGNTPPLKGFLLEAKLLKYCKAAPLLYYILVTPPFKIIF